MQTIHLVHTYLFTLVQAWTIELLSPSAFFCSITPLSPSIQYIPYPYTVSDLHLYISIYTIYPPSSPDKFQQAIDEENETKNDRPPLDSNPRPHNHLQRT
jgi:hypothetical protein